MPKADVIKRVGKVSQPLNLDKPECQLIKGTMSERSMWAENMSRSNRSVRCSKHGLFHNWEHVDGDTKRDVHTRGLVARFDGFVEVSVGKWVARDIKPKPKPKTDKKFLDN